MVFTARAFGLVIMLGTELHPATSFHGFPRQPLRNTVVFSKNERNLAGNKQLMLAKKLEEATAARKKEKISEDAALVQYTNTEDELQDSDEPIFAKRSWRPTQNDDPSYSELKLSLRSDESSSTKFRVEESVEFYPEDSDIPIYNPSQAGRLEYLKAGKIAPIEVWSSLQDVNGINIDFTAVAGDKPLLVCVTHYTEASAKLKSAVEVIDKSLPRKSFQAAVVVISRDTPAAVGRLMKKCSFPATFLSASERNDWCFAYGITPLVADFGVSCFIIETSTGRIFSVNYNCDPPALAEYIKAAIAAYFKRV